ncbi:sodium-independent anion transporter [Microbacterium deminutum]|uniref:STAS domain-containing protein n=1 Tax=Microbacterium deminutum TaxID=344164 RepID=A0ABP5C1K7_9MICO
MQRPLAGLTRKNLGRELLAGVTWSRRSRRCSGSRSIPAPPLFFANGDVFATAVKSAVTSAGGADAVHHMVIDMEAVTDIDVTASESFTALREWLDSQSITLAFSRVRSGARPRLEHFGIIGNDTSTRRTARRSRR